MERRPLKPEPPRWRAVLLLAVLTVLGGTSLAHILTKTSATGAVDFHSYWYAGHFMLKGQDPYLAALEQRRASGTFHYLDGGTVTDPPSQFPGYFPANTAPMVLLTTPLALFTFPAAFRLWTALNVLMTVLIALALARLLAIPALSWRTLGLWLLLVALIGTREVLEFGQTALIVLAAMLGALALTRRWPIAAGLLLGLALSKYSLSLPAAVLLLLYRHWLTTAVAAVVQIAGALAIAVLARTPPLTMIYSYLQTARLHANLPGYNFTALLLKPLGAAGAAPVVLLSLIVLGALVWWLRGGGLGAGWNGGISTTALALLAVLLIWDLQAVYHRRYDHVALIVLAALMLRVWDGAPPLPAAGRWGALAVFALLAGMWILPVYAATGEALYEALYELSLLAALALPMIILWRSVTTGRNATAQVGYDAAIESS